MPRNCQRCGQETLASIMSRFNTEIICTDCETKERAHPQYREAWEAEDAAVRRGNFNFPGIGRPEDL